MAAFVAWFPYLLSGLSMWYRTDGRGDMACVGLGPVHVLLPEAVEAESADKLGLGLRS